MSTPSTPSSVVPRTSRHRRLLAGAVVTAMAVLGACGGDDDKGAVPDATSTTETPEADLAADGSTLTIDAVDFAYVDLPDRVEPGTALAMTNGSTEEVHEAVVFRLAGGDTRPAQEIIAAATDPAEIGEFVGVAVALPGEEAQYPEGDIVFEEPGRYVIACFIPTGADPQAYAEAIATGEPPQGVAGEPHVAHGMFAEVVVEGSSG